MPDSKTLLIALTVIVIVGVASYLYYECRAPRRTRVGGRDNKLGQRSEPEEV